MSSELSQSQSPEFHDAVGWYYDETIHIELPLGMNPEKLLLSLSNNRQQLEQLKFGYYQAKKESQNIDCVGFIRDMKRTVMAIEKTKSRLAAIGVQYPFSPKDIEHPDDALTRISNIPPPVEPKRSHNKVFILATALGLVCLLGMMFFG